MKIIHTILSKFEKKLSGEDKIYLLLAAVFLVTLLGEFIKFLWSLYTFERMSVLFLIISCIYLLYKLKTSGKIGILKARGRKSQASKNFFALIFGGISFIYAGMVVGSFFFSVSYLSINISLLLLLAAYTLWKIHRESQDLVFPIKAFPEATFMKILIVGMGFTFMLLNVLSDIYSLIGEERVVFILLFMGLSVVFLTLLFSRIFQNTLHFFNSGEFVSLLKENIQITLSLLLFCFSSLFILIKIGTFDFLFVEKIESITEFVPQSERIILTEPEQKFQLKTVGEVYTLAVPLALGDSGEQVSILQEVLQKIGTYTQESNNVFDEYTRTTLRTTLIENCDWPETTQGILGPQAKTCLDSIQIKIPETGI